MEQREEASDEAGGEGEEGVDEEVGEWKFSGEDRREEPNLLETEIKQEPEWLEEYETGERWAEEEAEPWGELEISEDLQQDLLQLERETEEEEMAKESRGTESSGANAGGKVGAGNKRRNVRRRNRNSRGRTRSRGMSRSGYSLSESAVWDKLESEMLETALEKMRKLPKWMRRRGATQEFPKFLPPKDAVESIRELRPGCEFHVRAESADPPLFMVQVTRGGCVLGEGRGSSRETATEAAAEDAIKASVVKFLSESSAGPDSSNISSAGFNNHFSWNALASYAVHEVLKEWAEEGMNVPSPEFYRAMREMGSGGKAATDRRVPPDAEKINPASLLNFLRPDAPPFEVDQMCMEEETFVTVAYRIDGEIYTGRGSNKRDAGQAAAKLALMHLFGVKYDN